MPERIADPVVLAVIGQAVVIIGMLVKMLRDQLARGRRVEAAHDEHTRLDHAITASEARQSEAVKALDAELRRQRDRLHDQAEASQAAMLRVAVMETRIDNVDRALVRVERLLEGLDRKVDGLAEGRTRP